METEKLVEVEKVERHVLDRDGTWWQDVAMFRGKGVFTGTVYLPRESLLRLDGDGGCEEEDYPATVLDGDVEVMQEQVLYNGEVLEVFSVDAGSLHLA